MSPAETNAGDEVPGQEVADAGATTPLTRAALGPLTAPTIKECLAAGGAIAFTPERVVRVETPASVWILDADTYVRLPRHEGPRPGVESINGRLDDCVQHRHRGLWWTAELGTLHVRILPGEGPEHGYGVLTGIITSATGTWSEGHP